MKGCIIKNRELSIAKIFDIIDGVEKYNWMITNIECCPNDEYIQKILKCPYCWISGRDLLNLLQKEDFQWIWGVFSAFPPQKKLGEVLNYNLPYADGYTGFWENPISIQHPLANTEIVAWDGEIILVISKEDSIIKKITDNIILIEDLELYNMDI